MHGVLRFHTGTADGNGIAFLKPLFIRVLGHDIFDALL